MKKKLYFISLGCAKNQVDSEIMLHELESRGLVLTPDPEKAEVVIVNTCSFIESATRESIDTILEAVRLKQEGRCRVLAVAGCFPQRYRESLIAQLPEVDLFLGTESFVGIADQVLALLAGDKSETMILRPDPRLWAGPLSRTVTTGKGSAYLKIAEGCSNFCAYCTIPSIRGPFRSRDPGILLQEANNLAEQGVRELNLVAQDTTAYGTDVRPSSSLTALLKALTRIESLAWLRLLYLRPERITRPLLELMAEEEKICPYLDIPVQHISDAVLKRMNRPYRGKKLRGLISRIRQLLPQAALRSTVMVGFPGEGEREFQELLNFITEVEFDHLGVFPFSPEEGTPAARYADQVPLEISQKRVDLLMERQKEISFKKNRARIGTLEPVLVTGLSPESDLLIQGRTRFQAPEADGVIYLTRGQPRFGEIQMVKITEAHPYDLVGEICE